jgi:hypothetical protein
MQDDRRVPPSAEVVIQALKPVAAAGNPVAVDLIARLVAAENPQAEVIAIAAEGRAFFAQLREAWEALPEPVRAAIEAMAADRHGAN